MNLSLVCSSAALCFSVYVAGIYTFDCLVVVRKNWRLSVEVGRLEEDLLVEREALRRAVQDNCRLMDLYEDLRGANHRLWTGAQR